MMTIREYKQAESLEEAWQLNQKKANRVLGGMIWLKMENINVGTAIDLSGLGLDTIEETEGSFSIGAMVTLRQLEEHAVLALSVWTAALAEEMQTGISPRGMIIHGAVQALLLTCISGVFSACWQRAAMQWVWLFSAGAWFLAELFGTVMQAQNICQQEFRSMALIGLLPLLLWAGWCIPPSGWDAPARVLWWFVLLGGLVCLTGLAGQMDWAHLLTADAVQLARWPRVPLYAEYLFWPLLAGYEEPRSMSWLPWLTFLAQAGLTAGMCLVFGAADYPAQELLRAWSADVFSRMDALLLLIWLTCAIFRTGFLCAAVRTVWQRAVQCGKGAVK